MSSEFETQTIRSYAVMIRPEAQIDQQAIYCVNKGAFGTGAEAELVDALRGGGFVEASLVAEVGGAIVGHILFSRVTITRELESITALSLAPMAVRPEYQRQGIGSRLVKAGLEVCRANGHRIALVLGHPRFYSRFGFTSELARQLESPFGGGEAWMAIELEPGALAAIGGRVRFSPPFGVFEA